METKLSNIENKSSTDEVKHGDRVKVGHAVPSHQKLNSTPFDPASGAQGEEQKLDARVSPTRRHSEIKFKFGGSQIDNSYNSSAHRRRSRRKRVFTREFSQSSDSSTDYEQYLNSDEEDWISERRSLTEWTKLVATFKENFKRVFSQLQLYIPNFGDDFFHLFSTGGVMIFQMFRSRTIADRMAAAYQFLAANFPYVTDSIGQLLTTLAKHLGGLFTEMIQAESLSDKIFSMKSTMKIIMSSEIVQSLRNFIMMLMSFKMFGSDHSKVLRRTLGKPSKCSYIDAAEIFIDAVGNLMKAGEATMNGCLSSVVLSSDPISQLLVESRALFRDRNRVCYGITVEGMIDAPSYYVRLTKTRAMLEKLISTLHSKDPRLEPCKDSFGTLTDIMIDMRRESESRTRAFPFGVILTGPAGIGKSKLVTDLAALGDKVRGRKFNKHNIYSRCISSDYAEGYEPLAHKTMHYSEVGNTKKDIVASRGDPILEELNRVMDTLPCPMNMAFDGKGKVYAMPEFVIIDTNNGDLHASVCMHDPEAMRRRFLLVEISVKAEFRIEGSVALDVEKSLLAGGNLLDRYHFTITKRSSGGYANTLLRDGTYLEYRSIVKDLMHKHFEKGDAAAVQEYFDSDNDTEEELEYEEILVTAPKAFDDDESTETEDFDLGEILHAESEPWYSKPIFTSRFKAKIKREASFRWEQSKAYFNDWTGRVVEYFFSPTSHTNMLRFNPFVFPFFMAFLTGFSGVFTWVAIVCATVNPNFIALLAGNTLRAFIMRKFTLWRMHATERRKYFEGCVYNPFTTQWWAVNGDVVITLTALFVMLRTFFKAYGFLEDIDPESAIDKWEDTFDCKESYKRVPVHGTNVWNDTYLEHPSIHKGSQKDLWRRATKSTRRCIVRVGDRAVRTIIFGICEDFAIINTHAHAGRTDFTIEILSDEGNIRRSIHVDSRLVSILQNDITVFRLIGERFTNMLKHIVADGTLPERGVGFVNGERIRIISHKKLITYQDIDANVELTNWIEYNWEGHGRGQCGSPVFMRRDSGVAIVAIHAAGSRKNNFSVGTVLSRKLIEISIKEISAKSPICNIHSESEMDLDLTEPNSKSPFRYEYLPFLSYRGKLPGATLINKKSRLQVSKLKPLTDFIEVKDPVIYGIPVMKPLVIDGEYVSPYNIALRKMNKPSGHFDSKILTKVIVRYSVRIIKMLRSREVPKLHPLTLKAAVNGAIDDPFIRRINASTSAGFGFVGSKSTHIPLVDELERYPTEELQSRLMEQLSIYSDLFSNNYIFKSQLKDEARPLEKCKGKTRVFYMSPLDNLIVARMFLSPFYSLMVEHGDIFGTAVGINVHESFDDIYRKFLAFSPLIMEGDYSNYDQNMPVEIGMAANSIVFKVLKNFGYNSDALKQVQGVLSDALFPFVDMNNDLFVKPGLQPSGKYATAEDNSLRNVIMMMYAWYSSPHLEHLDFFEHVLPLTYGDDLLASVKPSVKTYYNSNYYQQVCEEIYNLGYTNAAKDSDIADFMSVDCMSFLKRKFVFSEHFKKVVGPIDASSPIKTLSWIIPSTTVSPEEQYISIINSVLIEVHVLWQDWEKLNEFRNAAIDILVLNYEGERSYYSNRLHDFAKLDCIILGVEPESFVITKPNNLQTMMITTNPYIELYRAGHMSLKEGRGDQVKLGLENNSDDILPDGKLDVERGIEVDAVKVQSYTQLKQFVSKFRFAEPGILSVHELVEFYRQQKFAIEEALSGVTMGRPLWHFTHKPTLLADPSLRAKYRFYKPLFVRIQECIATISVTQRLMDIQLMHLEAESELVGDQRTGLIDPSKVDEKQNFVDVGGENIHSVSGGESKTLDIGQDNLLDISEFFQRPIEIANYAIGVGIPSTQQFSVWDLYTINPTIRSKLRNYAYLKGNLHVRISVSGTPFHLGRLMVSYQPYPERNDVLVAHLAELTLSATWRPLILNYLSQAKGSVVINVNENEPVEICCPYIGLKPAMRLFNSSGAVISAVTSYDDAKEFGDLFIYTLNNVDAVSSGLPSSVNVQVYAWMSEVELGTPTGTQLDITTESDPLLDEREVGPVERVSSAMYRVSNALTSLPVIGELAKASAIGFGALSKISSIFGWSYPVMNTEPNRVKSMPYQNGANTVGYSTGKRITYDPRQELTIDPRVAGVVEDEMAIAVIASRETYLTTFEWAVSDVPLTGAIWLSRVHPQLNTWIGDAIKRYFQPTAMSFAVTPFWYWRGTIEFRFDIVASKYHRGKLAFYYEPNIAQAAVINADLSTNKQFMRVIDIQETQSVTFCIEWSAPRAWQLVDSGPNTWRYYGSDFEPSVNSYEYSNGYIGVSPFTTIQSPDNSNININVFVKCKDLQVNQLNQSKLPTEIEVTTESLEITTESMMVSFEKETKDIDNSEVQCLSLNNTSASTDNICDMHFGEQPLSFRSALKRYATTARFVVPLNATTAAKRLAASFLNIPEPTPLLGSVDSSPHLFGYLRYAYLGLRGGMSKRVFTFLDNLDNQLSPTKVTLRLPESFLNASVVFSSSAPASEENGTVSFIPATNGGIEVEVPYYSNNLFAFSFARDLVGSNSDNDANDEWSRRYQVQIAMHGATDAGEILEDSATAEDFTFLRFQGAPMFTFKY